MDVEYMNSPQEATQMEIMAMMMGMDKLHELSKWPQGPSTQHSSCPSAAVYNNVDGVGTSSVPSLLVGAAHSVPFCDGLERYVGAAMRPISPNASELSFGESFGGKRLAPVEAMREMIFRIAAMQPIHIDPESVKPPKRRNVRISKDPQSVAARHRRERISERIRILQRLVPGGTKMDTASMLEEAIHYMKFLKNQVQSLEQAAGMNQKHFGGSNAMTTTSRTEAGFSPDVNKQLSIDNYYEAMSDQRFGFNTTTTQMFFDVSTDA